MSLQFYGVSPMYLYKYLDFETFVSMIETKRLFLRNIKTWEDPFEGYIPFHQIKDNLNKAIFGNMKDLNSKARDEILKYRNILYSNIYQHHCYAQSWIIDDTESDALWRIYSQKKGVRIKINRDNLIKTINEHLISMHFDKSQIHHLNIEYSIESPPLLLNETNCEDKDILFKQIAGYKRKAFEHEKEFRIGFFYPVENNSELSNLNNEIDTLLKNGETSDFITGLLKLTQLSNAKFDLPTIIPYGIELNTISEIILDPRAQDYHRDLFFQYCKNRQLNDYGITIMQSGLYNRE